MLDSGKLPGLGGSTPEAECQWWADRLGDEKTRGDRLSAYEKMMPTVFPHLTRRRSPVEGAFNPGGARRGLTRRRAAQPCRVHSLPVRGGVVIEWTAELLRDTDRFLRRWPCAA